MKKQYTKPHLFVERFTLTQMLTTCGLHIGHADSNCVMKDNDATGPLKDFAAEGWFLGGCAEFWEGDDVYDGICLHVSVNLMFTS